MQVPRYSEPQVQLNPLPTPQRSGSSPVAQGIGELGGALGSVGRDLQQHAMEQKHFADSSAVMEAQVSLNNETMQLQNLALSRQGHDALDNKEAYDAFDATYKRHQGLMKNETQARTFAAQTANDRNQFTLSLERHASEQGKILGQTNATALVETDMQKLSTLYRDPDSFDKQLQVTQAHTLDMLHMHGIADTDPAAKEKLAEVKSKAQVDRIKQMMTDNPSEAQHLFEVHQDEIEPSQREALQRSVHAMSEQRQGIDAAEALTPEIMKGTKSYTELRTQLYNQLKDKPGAFKVAEAQLRGNYQAAKEDRAELVGGLGSKVEQAISEGIAADKPVTPKMLAALPEYQSLIKNGSKEALAEASRFMGQANREKHDLEREARADQRERRADQRQSRLELKQNQLEITAAYDDPDLLTSHTDADLQKLAPQIGYANVKKLQNQRHKYLKDDTALEHAKVDRDVLVNEMGDAGMKYVISPAKADSDEYKATAKIKAKVEQQMRWEAERTGKPVSPDRQREIIRAQMLKVHVTKAGRMWGINTDDVPQYAANADNYDFPGVPSEDMAMVVTALRNRGIEPTYEQVKSGLAAFKKGR